METYCPKKIDACEEIYQNALLLMEGKLFTEAAKAFGRVSEYKDASKRKDECDVLAEAARKDAIYFEAEKAASNLNVRSQEKAIRIYNTIAGWRDADARAQEAARRIEEIRIKERVDRQEAILTAQREHVVTMKRKKHVRLAILLTAAFAALCFLGTFLFQNVVTPALKYHNAVKLIEAGNTDDAYYLLHNLNFRNSGVLAGQIIKGRLSDAEIGSTVKFGFYQQGRKTSKEKDPIEWKVLDKDGTKVLLISKYALDCIAYQSYDERSTYTTWESSMIRKWLNVTFLNEAFDKDEAQLLVNTKLDVDPETSFFFPENGPIGDRVFLLSSADAEKYFPDDGSRQCLATRFAVENGAYQSSVGKSCLWWLRTTMNYDGQMIDGIPMENVTRVALISTSGRVVSIGHYMYNRNYCVRPAIWVDLGETGD